MSQDLFKDPKAHLKQRAAKLVVPESEIRKAMAFTCFIKGAAHHIGVSQDRFKKYAARYIDPDTGLTLLDLMKQRSIIVRAERMAAMVTKKHAVNSFSFTEQEIRKAMEVSESNKDAAQVLGVTVATYKKYASQFIDEETGMNLYELQFEKFRKIRWNRYLLKKEMGFFDNIAERKEKWEAQKFKKGEMPWSERPESWKYHGLQITEEVIRGAMKHTRSNKEAAAWLKVQYKTYRKYAKSYIDEKTGRSLFDLHISTGKGIPKARKNKTNPRSLELGYQLIPGQYCTPDRIEQLTLRLMKDGRLGHCCSECGFNQKRPIDMKMPLMLNFKNGDRTDWREENLNWLCYNCAFILAVDLTKRLKRQVLNSTAPEAPDAPPEVKSFYNIDDFYLEHLRALGVSDLAEEVKPKKDDKNPLPEDLIDFRD